MQFKMIFTGVMVSLALATGRHAVASDGLDFGYTVDGPLSLRPQLVFNDGTDTYVQPAGEVHYQIKGAIPDGPYLRVPGMPNVLTIVANHQAMHVHHIFASPPNSTGEAPVTQYGAATASKVPTKESLSPNETELSGMAASTSGAHLPVAGPVGHTSHAAPSATPLGQLRAQSEGHGAQTHETSVNGTGALPSTVARSYQLLPQDGTVSMSLARWAGMSGWTVSWPASISAPITAPSEPLGAGRFVPAVKAVLSALRQAGYPLNASFGDRNVRIYKLTSPGSTTTTTTAETLQ